MQEKFNPLVSIVIPVYNGSNYMREAIDSALAQTYDNIEIIVVNDGSKDNTEEIALSYGDKIRYFTKENGGVATALNLGIENMRGEYFSWLSHDDLYMPDKIEKQVTFIAEHCNPETIVYSGFEFINEQFEIMEQLNHTTSHPMEKLNTPLFPIFKGLIHGCSLLIHKSHFEHVGLFDVNLPTTQDYDLWFKIFRNSDVRYLPQILVKSRVHSEQGSFKVKNHLDECSELWINLMNSLTEEEMLKISGSKLQFYREMTNRFTNYEKAHKCAKRSYEYELKSKNKRNNFNINKVISEIKSTTSNFKKISNSLAQPSKLTENKKPIISIIVPVYNVERYLTQCLCSLINQSFKSIEIIVVNDGSTDRSGEIADKFALAYPDIIRVFHKTNTGQSDSRNFGLKHAKGEFIGYVDSDDFVDSKMYEKMHKEIIKGYDIIICELSTFDNVNMKIAETFGFSGKINYNAIDNIVRYSTAEILPSPCNKLFRKKLLEHYQFPSIVCEDVAFCPVILSYANKVGIIKESFYFYRINRKGSTMATLKSDSVFLGLIDVWKNIINNINEKYKEDGVFAIYMHMLICIKEFPRFVPEFMSFFSEMESTFVNNKYIGQYILKNSYYNLFDTITVPRLLYENLFALSDKPEGQLNLTFLFRKFKTLYKHYGLAETLRRGFNKLKRFFMR